MPESSKKRTRLLLLCFAVLAVAVLSTRLPLDRSPTKLRCGPLVQFPEPGQLSVSWNMASGAGCELVVTSSTGQTQRQRPDQIGDRFEASVSHLEAGSAQSFKVVMRGLLFDTVLSGPNDVVLPPPPGRAFRFLAFGDSGIGGNAQFELAQLMTAAKPDLIIHTGDLIYPSGQLADYPANFFQPYAELIRRIPFMPSIGNHDAATEHGKPLLDTFELPRNGPPGIEPERNYWFDFGDARFVAMDSCPPEEQGVISLEQRQQVIAPWLRKVLTETKARWRFVFFHHPFYTGSEHPESGGEHMKKPFVQVFEECGVDGVFCGHNHLYERTAPMKSDKIVREGEGVVYITTGAGGNSRYNEAIPPPPYIRAFNDKVFSFTQVDLKPDRLELRQIGEDGKVLDQYTIAKTGRS